MHCQCKTGLFNRFSVNRLKPAGKNRLTVVFLRITPPIRFSDFRKCHPVPISSTHTSVEKNDLRWGSRGGPQRGSSPNECPAGLLTRCIPRQGKILSSAVLRGPEQHCPDSLVCAVLRLIMRTWPCTVDIEDNPTPR